MQKQLIIVITTVVQCEKNDVILMCTCAVVFAVSLLALILDEHYRIWAEAVGHPGISLINREVWT